MPSGRGQRTWNGVALLARGTRAGASRRSLPGDADDHQRATSRRPSTACSSPRSTCPTATRSPARSSTTSWPGSSACSRHARSLAESGHPVVLAGDYNVVPTDADIYATRSWLKNALLQPAPRAAYRRLLAQGWTDAIRALHPDERIYTFWDYLRNRLAARRRPAHRPPAAERERAAAPAARRRRPRRARARERERPRAGLDRTRVMGARAPIKPVCVQRRSRRATGRAVTSPRRATRARTRSGRSRAARSWSSGPTRWRASAGRCARRSRRCSTRAVDDRRRS